MDNKHVHRAAQLQELLWECSERVVRQNAVHTRTCVALSHQIHTVVVVGDGNSLCNSGASAGKGAHRAVRRVSVCCGVVIYVSVGSSVRAMMEQTLSEGC